MRSQYQGILLVEDDEDDVFLMERALSKAKLDPPLYVAANGQEAIDYLAGNGKYADRTTYPIPGCIFLDLKLPFRDGFEVLEWIRSETSLAPSDVFVLTFSPEDRDRERAEQLGAKAYLIKPPTPQMLIKVMGSNPSCFPAAAGPGISALDQ
ncbi:MAG TPA: response regulator [Verrucomicrobiae bacterium]|nr:response regulator [Verrucomicrobiae bacterium]